MKIAFLISENYQHNSSHINCVKIINIEHVQLKLLTFKNDLILMGISKVFFITETVISTADENISNIVDHFWLINDIEIELWEKLISAGLMMIEFINNGEVFQILVISEHSYRVSSAMNFKISLFKYFNNNQ